MNPQQHADAAPFLKALEDMLADGDLNDDNTEAQTMEQEALLAELERVDERLEELSQILNAALALTSMGFPPPDEVLPALNAMMLEAIVLNEYNSWLHEQLQTIVD